MKSGEGHYGTQSQSHGAEPYSCLQVWVLVENDPLLPPTLVENKTQVESVQLGKTFQWPTFVSLFESLPIEHATAPLSGTFHIFSRSSESGLEIFASFQKLWPTQNWLRNYGNFIVFSLGFSSNLSAPQDALSTGHQSSSLCFWILGRCRRGKHKEQISIPTFNYFFTPPSSGSVWGQYQEPNILYKTSPDLDLVIVDCKLQWKVSKL